MDKEKNQDENGGRRIESWRRRHVRDDFSYYTVPVFLLFTSDVTVHCVYRLISIEDEDLNKDTNQSGRNPTLL